VRLRPFTSGDLPLVEPWFADADTQRWLGGPGWPRLVLTGHPLGEYRGAAETGSYDWLAADGELVVGYIGCGTYDRWTTWEGGPGSVVAVELDTTPAPTLFFALGERGKPAERVADEACDAVIAYLDATPALVASRSATAKPTLCRLREYSGPGLPSPATIHLSSGIAESCWAECCWPPRRRISRMAPAY